MRIDLEPINPSKDAPRYPAGYSNQIKWGGYSVRGWRELIKLLDLWNVNTEEFYKFDNDKIISELTCLKVANAIEYNLPKLSREDQEWLEPDITLWRTCGGYRVW